MAMWVIMNRVECTALLCAAFFNWMVVDSHVLIYLIWMFSMLSTLSSYSMVVIEVLWTWRALAVLLREYSCVMRNIHALLFCSLCWRWGTCSHAFVIIATAPFCAVCKFLVNLQMKKATLCYAVIIQNCTVNILNLAWKHIIEMCFECVIQAVCSWQMS